MHHTPPPTPAGRTAAHQTRRLRTWVAPALIAVLACVATACGGKSDTATTVALDRPVSSSVPADATLAIGDPVT